MRTLVLGAGFGGITVASELRRQLGADHEVLLLDRRESFMMGLRKPWALVGLGTLEEGRRPRARLSGDGVRFVQADVRVINPAARTVLTDVGSFDGDFLVIALGAQPRPDLVPGLADHAHDLYDADAIPALANAIRDFNGGSILIVIAGVPYRCPPAPYETAMLLDEQLRARGLRERTSLTVTTLQPMLLPNAGREGSAWLAEQLTARGIDFRAGQKVQRVARGRVVYESGELDADLLIGVPPHRPPAVVKESGLTGDGEWVIVDPGTLATMYPNVFAIGDVTQIMLANQLPLPKAGLFAELQGERVAAAIAAEVRGEPAPAPFDGRGYCFLETGATGAARVEGDFYARPEPRVQLVEPTVMQAEEKRRFEAERLARWFGS
jgi:sulfide:quinone oxidoreductase